MSIDNMPKGIPSTISYGMSNWLNNEVICRAVSRIRYYRFSRRNVLESKIPGLIPVLPNLCHVINIWRITKLYNKVWIRDSRILLSYFGIVLDPSGCFCYAFAIMLFGIAPVFYLRISYARFYATPQLLYIII